MPTPDTGRRILDWCRLGTSCQQVEQLIQQAADMPTLVSLYNQYPEFRQALKSRFIERKEQIQSQYQTK